MSEKMLESLGRLEEVIGELPKEKQDVVIDKLMTYGQGFAAGMMVRDAKKDQKGE